MMINAVKVPELVGNRDQKREGCPLGVVIALHYMFLFRLTSCQLRENDEDSSFFQPKTIR